MNLQLSARQIGERIAGLRKLKGISQKELAVFLDIPRSSVAQIESGKRNISATELMRLAEVLDFSMDKFLSSEFKIYTQAADPDEPLPLIEEPRVSVPALNSRNLKMSYCIFSKGAQGNRT